MNLLRDVNLTGLLEPKKTEEPKAKPLASLLSELNSQSLLKKSDATDAGKNDVVDKANASQDIGFNLMRNTINSAGQITGSDVADYIERAEELNDEVDTVPFGLETDDGQIVKVYVNAEQADKFEEAMKNMLGMEDDIEEAINRLTTEFDIIDVVWPKAEEEEVEDEDEDLIIDDASTLEDEEDDDFAEDKYEVVASVADDETEQEDENAKNSVKPKKKSIKPKPATEDLEAEEFKQEKNMSFGSKFLERVLQEATPEDRDSVKDGFNIPLDSQARALTAKLKLPFAKRLVAFHAMCGVPGRYLNTEDVEGTISEAADMLRKKVAVRRAFMTLYEDLANAKGFALPTETNEALEEAEEVPNVGIVLMKDDKLLGWYTGFQGKVSKSKSRASKFSKRAARKELKLISADWDLGPGERLTLMPLVEAVDKPEDANIGIAVMKDDKLLGWYITSNKTITKSKAKATPFSRKGARKELKFLSTEWELGPGEKLVMMPLAEAEEETIELQALSEARQKRGSFIQKLLESVMVQLGLPESMITTTGPAAVGTGIYRTAELIEQDSTLERALRLLATRLGIKANDAQAPVQETLDREGYDSLPEDPAKTHGKFSIGDAVIADGRSGKIKKFGGDGVFVVFDGESRAQEFDISEIKKARKVKEELEEAKAPKLPKDKDVPIEVQGTKGMKSTPWSKKFKNQEAMEKWMEKHGDDITVLRYSTDRVFEDVKDIFKEAVDIGSNDDYANAVVSLASALGIPDVAFTARKPQVVQSLRKRRAELRNRTQVLTMMSRLESLISRNTVAAGGRPEEEEEAERPNAPAQRNQR